jgi:outer membrane immunogenic protein
LIADETQSGFASGVLEGPVLIHQNRSNDIIGIHMKKIILATVLAGIGSTAALAADLGARTYTKAPAMVNRVYNWTGFYIGGNVGYGWGENNTDFNFLPSAALFGANNASLGVNSRGVIGGVQLGYNMQIGITVIGFETDIQGAGISGSATKQPTFLSGALIPGASMVTDQKLSWFGTSRGRLGFTVTPELLVYGTGGAAYGQAKTTGNASFLLGGGFDDPAALSQTKLGWTAGAGTEWMFARNWSAKFEYLYVDLGTTSAIGLDSDAPASGSGVRYTWKHQDHIVRGGVNYHF